MEESKGSKDPRPVSLTILDRLEIAKSEIFSNLEKHLSEDKFLSGSLREMKEDELETLIMPVASNIIEGNEKKLNLSALCEATPDLHQYVSTRFGFLMSNGCKNILKKDYLSVYIEPNVELKNDATDTVFSFKDGLTDAEICRFHYFKKNKDDFGSLRFVFSNELASRGRLAEKDGIKA